MKLFIVITSIVLLFLSDLVIGAQLGEQNGKDYCPACLKHEQKLDYLEEAITRKFTIPQTIEKICSSFDELRRYGTEQYLQYYLDITKQTMSQALDSIKCSVNSEHKLDFISYLLYLLVNRSEVITILDFQKGILDFIARYEGQKCTWDNIAKKEDFIKSCAYAKWLQWRAASSRESYLDVIQRFSEKAKIDDFRRQGVVDHLNNVVKEIRRKRIDEALGLSLDKYNAQVVDENSKSSKMLAERK